MKYEICKEIMDNGVLIWSAIAWTDVYTYAVEIVDSLNINQSSLYAVLENDVVIYS